MHHVERTSHYTGEASTLKKFLYKSAVIDFETKNVPVNSIEQRVLEIIRNNQAVTYDEIAERIGKTRKTASRAIASLKEQGLIRREGSDKAGFWAVE